MAYALETPLGRRVVAKMKTWPLVIRPHYLAGEGGPDLEGSGHGVAEFPLVVVVELEPRHVETASPAERAKRADLTANLHPPRNKLFLGESIERGGELA